MPEVSGNFKSCKAFSDLVIPTRVDGTQLVQDVVKRHEVFEVDIVHKLLGIFVKHNTFSYK